LRIKFIEHLQRLVVLLFAAVNDNEQHLRINGRAVPLCSGSLEILDALFFSISSQSHHAHENSSTPGQTPNRVVVDPDSCPRIIEIWIELENFSVKVPCGL